VVSAKITNFAFVKRRSDARVAEEARLESVFQKPRAKYEIRKGARVAEEADLESL